ncbi:MAG: SRPBCC family protein [Solirubrobacteraceae bacterium]
MSLVTATVEIAAPPARVWETVMDPSCLKEWVTIHRRLVRADEGSPRVGFTMDQQIQLRGVNLEVHWCLTDCREGELAVWEGRGPARSRAHSEYRLREKGSGTCFDYRNEFRPPLGPLGAIVSRALVGGMPLREANRTLACLKEHVEGKS